MLRSSSLLCRSRDRKRRRTRSRSKSTDWKRRKSPAPQKVTAKESNGTASAKKASKDTPKVDKVQSGKGKGSVPDKQTPKQQGKPADAGRTSAKAAGAEQHDGVSEVPNGTASQETPVTAPPATGADLAAPDALPNGDKKAAVQAREDTRAGEKGVQENGHVSKEKVTGSGSGGESSADSSRHSRSPSGSPPKRRRRSASSRSVSSASTGRVRRRKVPSRSPSGKPPRRRFRSDSPPLRRRRSGSRRRSLSRWVCFLLSLL